jgi:hypothetical protein
LGRTKRAISLTTLVMLISQRHHPHERAIWLDREKAGEIVHLANFS